MNGAFYIAAIAVLSALLGYMVYKYYKLCQVVIHLDKSLEWYAKKVVGADKVRKVKQQYGVPEHYPDFQGKE